MGMVKPIADYFLRVCVDQVLPDMGTVRWVGLVFMFGWISNWYWSWPQRL